MARATDQAMRILHCGCASEDGWGEEMFFWGFVAQAVGDVVMECVQWGGKWREEHYG